jgi:hypothetical protein
MSNNQNTDPPTPQTSSINNGYEVVERQSIDSKPPSYLSIFPNKKRCAFLTKFTSRIKPNPNDMNTQVTSNTTTTQVTSNTTTDTLPPMSYADFVQSSVHTNAVSINDPPEVRRQKQLIKKLESLFKHSYYLRHFIVVSAASFSIMSIQIILTTNNALFSNFYCGIWIGILNLFLILLSINTCKFLV